MSDGCFVYRDTAYIAYFDDPIVVSVDSTVYGQLVVLAEQGSEPYTYTLNGSYSQSENVFRNLKDGENEIYVTDANGCKAIVKVVLDYNLGIYSV